ncbi:MAG: polysaccharide deacetylase [Pelosinus sp.]|jgi:peptidoglycan/xylan/chitin deacetylase (PgdA/CDA1 family)|nr:polysaccharide deacetylase [Pelosinus sp.]
MKNKSYLILYALCAIILFLTACTPLKKPETETVPKIDTNILSAHDDKYKRGHNIPGKLYWAGSAEDKKIALTFDDGPEEHWTPKILAILEMQQVKATFFVIGEQVQRHPEMLREIFDEGHVVGNHTFHHVNLVKAETEQVKQELEKGASIIKDVIGKTPKLVRPPFGFHNENVDAVIYAKKDIIVLWSLDTEDWQGFDSRTVKDSVLSKMQNGFIVLQHNGVNTHLGGSVESLSDIIIELKKQGYAFVTIPELLEIEPYEK